MDEELKKYKDLISEYLEEFLDELEKSVEDVNLWGSDIIVRLKNFVSGGKFLRGSIIVGVYKALNGYISKDAVKAAAAAEIFHSALLIHDDIIDQDELRRGKKTIFAQYEDRGKQEDFDDSKHFGYGMGICVGDICIAAVYDILRTLDVEDKIKSKVIHYFSGALHCVGLAEMDDIYLGNSKENPKEERVLKMYINKTSRYTFSLPFVVGATLAGYGDSLNKKLFDLGDKLGIIFQIKDDEMGLFGDESSIGKPIGSDISENKKTLFRLYVFEEASEEERETLKKIFGKKGLSDSEINYVKDLIDRLGIRERIIKKIYYYEEQVKELIEETNINQDFKDFLYGIMNYNLKRTK